MQTTRDVTRFYVKTSVVNSLHNKPKFIFRRILSDEGVSRPLSGIDFVTKDNGIAFFSVYPKVEHDFAQAVVDSDHALDAFTQWTEPLKTSGRYQSPPARQISGSNMRTSPILEEQRAREKACTCYVGLREKEIDAYCPMGCAEDE